MTLVKADSVRPPDQPKDGGYWWRQNGGGGAQSGSIDLIDISAEIPALDERRHGFVGPTSELLGRAVDRGGSANRFRRGLHAETIRGYLGGGDVAGGDTGGGRQPTQQGQGR